MLKTPTLHLGIGSWSKTGWYPPHPLDGRRNYLITLLLMNKQLTIVHGAAHAAH